MNIDWLVAPIHRWLTRRLHHSQARQQWLEQKVAGQRATLGRMGR
jgi:hypothetical protein